MSSDRPRQKALFAPEPDRPAWEIAAEEDRVLAEVAINRPFEQTFHYLIPESLRELLGPGQRVEIPFGKGNRNEIGFCVGLTNQPVANRRLKEITALVDREPIVDEQLLELTKWMADRYLCGWGQALATAIPAGVRKQAGTRELTFFTLADNIDELLENQKLPSKQLAIVEYLRSVSEPVRGDAITEHVGCSPAPIHGLRDKGLVVQVRKRTSTFDASLGHIDREPDLELNPDQKRALSTIVFQLKTRKPKTFVLHGVTGSGKTEVYIQAIREVVSYGRQAIVLVPEISLTPQTIRRFRSRFDSVAVLHSHLTDAERHWHWQQIASGDVQVVVGARSAIFAPTPHLGLIIIDEEHENTFKQDTAPRYHAREVARHRAELCGIPLILGSATPTLETWAEVIGANAECGVRNVELKTRQPSTEPSADIPHSAFRTPHSSTLLSLPNRVSGLPLPPVTLVDIRNDPLCSKGHSIGRALRTGVQTALNDNGQVILFLNLQGYSPTVWCEAAGRSVKYRDCDITYVSRDRNIILCHCCGAEMPPPQMLPAVWRAGHSLFRHRDPAARTGSLISSSQTPRHPHGQRHDAETRQPRRGSRNIPSRQAHILVGTPDDREGLDFPDVTLVGVVDADTVLHQADLRASRRTFQLISQKWPAGQGGASGRSSLRADVLADRLRFQKSVDHDFWA